MTIILFLAVIVYRQVSKVMYWATGRFTCAVMLQTQMEENKIEENTRKQENKISDLIQKMLFHCPPSSISKIHYNDSLRWL